MHRVKLRQNAAYSAFILPAAAVFAAFFIFPFFKSIWLSLTDAYGYRQDINFIGLKNYAEALSNKAFLSSLWVTVKYTALVTVAANVVRCCWPSCWTGARALKSCSGRYSSCRI